MKLQAAPKGIIANKPIITGTETTLRESLQNALEQNNGEIIEDIPPCAIIPTQTDIPTVMTDRMAFVWLRLGYAMRWLVLDHLRRFTDYVEQGNYIGYGNEKSTITITDNNGAFLAHRGSVEIEYRLPVATRKQPEHFRITYKASSGKIEETNIEDIVTNKQVFIDPVDAFNMPVLGHNMRRSAQTSVTVEPAVKAVLNRVPKAISEELMMQVALNRVATYMTHPLGETSQNSKTGMGFETEAKGKEIRIKAHGRLSDGIYYQRGRLMVLSCFLGCPQPFIGAGR